MPSFEVKHTEELKKWLVQELEPICDADPEVLSDYVLALLRHDASEGDLQTLLKEQLEDFLSEKTSAFVTKTMGALKSQNYLPHPLRSTSASQQAESSTSSKKRSAEDEGRRSPAKMHRMPEDDGPPRGPSGSREVGRPDNRRDRNGTKPPCRDFHMRGFCPRGDECRYDHTIQAMSEQNFNPMHQLSGMQQGQQQFPMHGMPNAQQMHFTMSGQPSGFPIGMQGGPGWPLNGDGGPQQQQGGISATPAGGTAGNGPDGGFDLGARMGPQFAGELPFNDGASGFRGGTRGGRGGTTGRGGARGTFEKRATSNTTLVIENVPVENLDLIKINEYFKKFGTITNIQIDVDSKKALVSYSQPSEAKAAHTSPEVIFNNRFVKVYFQKLDDPGIGTKPKEAAPIPAPTFKNNFIPGQTSNKFVRPDLALKPKEAQLAASQKLDALMAQQKEIMTKLTTPSTQAEEKKALMSQFGDVEKEIKAATEEIRLAVSNASATISKDASAAPVSDSSLNWREQKEVKQREQLDRELEAHSTGGSGSTTEELKAQLARLQEEATKLGIDSDAAATGRGGFRGRSRGAFRGAPSRGFSTYNARGRGGGATRATMSIDNRPTKLHISEVSNEGKEKAKEHFKQFGEFSTIEDKDDGSFIIHYKARFGGERALRAGLAIPDVGEIKASWVVDTASKQEGNASAQIERIDHADGAGEEGGEEQEDGDQDDRDDHFRR